MKLKIVSGSKLIVLQDIEASICQVPFMPKSLIDFETLDL